MTDETRKAARIAIENIVRAVSHGARIDHRVLLDGLTENIRLDSLLTEDERPELTPDKQLALSVLVGEPDSVIASALCDYLLDRGHDYAVECYEKGKREERERVMGVIGHAGEHMSAVLLSELTVAVESGRPPNPKAFSVSASGRV